jgi:hypothetical protein
MKRFDEGRLPDELENVARRLRDERYEASGLDLDRIKTRAMAQAASSRPKGIALRSRTMAAFLSLALMAGGTGGVIAAKGGNGNGSSGDSTYKPGCGPPASKQKPGKPKPRPTKKNGKPCPTATK